MNAWLCMAARYKAKAWLHGPAPFNKFVDFILGENIQVPSLTGEGQMRVLAFELVGTPFGYHKFRGGFSVEFVGFQMRYDTKEVGSQLSVVTGLEIGSSRRRRKGMWWSHVTSRRLGFVFQLLVWMKPHLSPLYAWSAATGSSTIAKLPDTVILTLKCILAELQVESYMVSAARPQTARVSSFAR